MANTTTRDRFRGCVLGAAVGDALGAPTEFCGMDQIRHRWGYVTDLHSWGGHQPGDWTDDTEMMLALGQALAQLDSTDALLDTDTVADAVCRGWVTWLETHQGSRAPGGTCLRGAASLKKGVHWTKSGKPNGNGCGSPMRVAPVGLVYAGHPEMLAWVANMQGYATHQGERTNAAAVAVSVLVSRLMLGDTWQQALEVLDGMLPDDSPARPFVHGALADNPIEEKLDKYRGWDGGEAFGAALACAMEHPDSYRDAVLRAINSPGDSDSLGCICGALMGAKYGATAIPPHWLEKLEQREELERLADALYDRYQELSNG